MAFDESTGKRLNLRMCARKIAPPKTRGAIARFMFDLTGAAMQGRTIV
jgi:hypothetical protein